MKRVRTITTLLVFIFALSSITASARASLYLSGYIALTNPGYNSGEIRVSFSVDATDDMDEVGVSEITLYASDGSYSTTVFGSTRNGMIDTDINQVTGYYTFKNLTSGKSYYAVVTVYAADANGSDARSITTKSAVAP